MTRRRLAELEVARRRREVAATAGSLLTSWAVLIAVYVLVGRTGDRRWTAVGVLVVGGLLFLVSLTRQFRKVLAAEVPELRAAQALGTVVVLFLVLFASTYLAFSPGSFSEPLDHVGALYFAVTVFATVGFGDITPVSDAARIVVAIQMLLDLVVIGVIVQVFVSAARSGLSGRTPAEGTDAARDGASSPPVD